MLLTYFRMHIPSLRCAIRATGGNRPQDYYMYKAGRYIRKDQPTIEEENTFFFHFQPVCSPP